MQYKKISFSLKKVKVVKGILSDFINWLEQVNINQSDREKLMEMKCLKKLFYIIQLLESETVKQRNRWNPRNKIAPSNTGDLHQILFHFNIV